MKFGYIEQLPCILDLKIDFWYMATKQNHPMKRPQTVKWVQQRSIRIHTKSTMAIESMESIFRRNNTSSSYN